MAGNFSDRAISRRSNSTNLLYLPARRSVTRSPTRGGHPPHDAGHGCPLPEAVFGAYGALRHKGDAPNL